MHRKNLWKFSVYLLDLRFLVHMPQVISKLSLVIHFLIWATVKPLKNRPLSAVLFWQISTNICVCRSIAFFFISFDHGTFGEVYIVVYALYVVVLSWNLNQKGLIHCYAYTNVANRIVFSFVWRKFSIVGIGEWWDELKNEQKLKLGDAHVTPRNIQEVQASKLEDAPEAPLLHRQKSGHLSTHYIFIASCTMRFSWSVSCFSFQFCIVSFAAINGWTPTNSFWRSCLAFHLPRTLCFSLLSFNECFLFLELRLVFIFLPWFVFRSSYIFASRCILTSGPCCFSSKELFQKKFEWCWKREKALWKKKWYKKELV
jgi:hypothetical protein